MSITASSSRPVNQGPPVTVEQFSLFSASESGKTETRLERPGQMFVPSTDDISTSISPHGWVATASAKQIRLYSTKSANKSLGIPCIVSATVEMKSKGESIQSIALSYDLLAVLTHTRLLVYDEYTASSGNTLESLVERKRIDLDQCWTPRTVAIAQTGTAARGDGLAYVAIGGEGENGVKVLRYEYQCGWNSSNSQMFLRCPCNIGAIKMAGFSPLHRSSLYGPMVLALTTGNRLYVWHIRPNRQTGIQRVQPIWSIDCNSWRDQHFCRGEITSATFLISPTDRPYVVCTVDHRHGSHLPQSFIVPITPSQDGRHTLRSQIKLIPETVLGRNTQAGIPSPNGRFLVVVERGKKEDMLKVLTLQGAHNGGLTCTSRVLTWKVKLRSTGTNQSAISMSIEEERGALEITVVDGRGHIAFARVSVPDLVPQREHVDLIRNPIELPTCAPAAHEFPA